MSRPVLRGVIIAALVAVLLPFAFAAGVAVRAAFGPVTLGFLNPLIASQLDLGLGDTRLRFADTILEWRDSRLNVAVVGAEAVDGAGRIVARAPVVDLDLSWRALLGGRFAVRRIELIGPSAALVRRVDGSIVVGIDPPRVAPAQTGSETAAGDGGSPLEGLMAALLAPDGDLDEIAVTGARLALEDRITGAFWAAPRAALRFLRSDDGVTLVGDAAVEVGGGLWTLAAEGQRRAGEDRFVLDVAFGEIRPASLAAASGAFAELADFDLPIRGVAQAVFGAGGRLERLGLNASGGEGTVRLRGLHAEPQAVGRLVLDATLDLVSDQIDIARAAIAAGGSRATLAGRVQLQRDAADLVVGGAAEIEVSELVVDAPERFEEPLAIDSARFAGSWLAGEPRRVKRLTLRRGDLALSFSGVIGPVGPASPSLAGEGTLSGLDVEDLKRIWPRGIGEGARRWVVENMAGGRIENGVLKLAISEGALDAGQLPEAAVDFSFDLSGAGATYIQGLTPISAAAGRGHLTGNTFRMTLSEGRAGPLAIAAAEAVIPDLHLAQPDARFTASITGSVPDMLRLIDMEPLGYPRRYGIDPASASGSARAELDLTVPTKRDLPISEVGIAVVITAEGLGIAFDETLALSDMAARFDVTGERLVATGDGRLAGAPVSVKWTERFAGSGDTTAVELRGLVPLGLLERMGLPLPMLSGAAIGVDAEIAGRRDTLSRVRFTADLGPPALDLPELGIAKPGGAPLRLSADVRLGDTIAISGITGEGSGLAIAGEAVLTPSGGLLSAELSRLRTGPGTDVSLSARRAGTGLMLTVRGLALDAGPLIEAAFDPGGSAPEPDGADSGEEIGEDWQLDLQTDALSLRDGIVYRDARLTAVSAGGRIEALSLSAQDEGGGALTAVLEAAAGGARTLSLSAGDAGGLIRGLTGFASIRGGRLRLSSAIAPPASAPDLNAVRPGRARQEFSGTLRLSDFMVLDQPFLARLFAAGSLTGLGDLLQGEGIRVSRFEIPFSATAARVRIRDAIMSGPALGGTVEGGIDRVAGAFDLIGTLVPIYGLNAFISEVPLIGDILASRRGEGIIGLTFAVRGPVDEPSISINPLSALAPGILRRLFEFSEQGEGVAQAPAEERRMQDLPQETAPPADRSVETRDLAPLPQPKPAPEAQPAVPPAVPPGE